MRGMVRMGALIWSLWMAGTSLFGATLFEQGNAAFKEGRFGDAEGLYRRHLAEEGDGSALRYNMGKARENLGDPGGAVLEWERAVRFNPGHQPSIAALAATRQLTGARVAPVQFWSVLRPMWVVGYEGWVSALGGWFVVCALLGAWLFDLRRSALALALSGTALLGGGLLWWREALDEAASAIVIERSVMARSVPAESSRPLGEWSAGSRVVVIGESASWRRCALPDGVVAWLPASAIERIVPSATTR